MISEIVPAARTSGPRAAALAAIAGPWPHSRIRPDAGTAARHLGQRPIAAAVGGDRGHQGHRRHRRRRQRHRRLRREAPPTFRRKVGTCQDSSKIPSEHKAIRESVSGIARGTAPRTSWNGAATARASKNCGRTSAPSGLLGVHLPEEYGGGGGGMAEAVVVVEELAANGMPMLIWVISPAICGSILAHHGSEAMKREWLPGTRRRLQEDGVRPDRARRRLQQPQRRDHRAPHRHGWTHLRVEVLHLGGRPGRRGARGGQGRRPLHTGEERAVAVRRPDRQPRAADAADRHLDRVAGQAVHACSSTTSRSARMR